MKVSNQKVISFILATILMVNAVIMNVSYVNASSTGEGFDLTITESVSKDGPGKKDLDLEWAKSGKFDESYQPQYYVARKNINTDSSGNPIDGSWSDWELRGIYASEDVRVLNIYPDREESKGFKSWMEEVSAIIPRVNITVDQVSLTDFNNNPTAYLAKNAEGQYDYHVVVFGFWDSNNRIDISPTASSVIREYLDSDYGVLFGHDTSNVSSGDFNSLVFDYVGLTAPPSDHGYWINSNKVRIYEQSTLSTYPFDVNGEDLIIPESHTLGRIPTVEGSVKFKFVKNYYPTPDDGPYFNYTWNAGGASSAKDDVYREYEGKMIDTNTYLTVNNNAAFIETGHTSGSTNIAERKILANTVYTLAQIHTKNNGIDQTLDMAEPTAPVPTPLAENYVNENTITFTANDNGTDYIYRVIEVPKGESISDKWDDINIKLNDTSLATYDIDTEFSKTSQQINTLAGVDHFIYFEDENPDTEVILGGVNEDITKVLGKDEAYVIPGIEDGVTENTYLHIAAVDGVKNVGPTTHIRLWDYIPDVQGTVQYLDKETDAELSPSTSVMQKSGTVYAPEVSNISGYTYIESDPSNNIVLSKDESLNNITHYYAENLIKRIYFVEYRKDAMGNEIQVIHPSYEEIEHPKNTIRTTLVPEIDTYTFKGYYTLGTENSTQVPVADNKFDLLWEDDGQNIYLHYSKDETTATVNVINERTGEVLDSYTENGYVGEPLIVTGDDLSTNISIPDVKYYKNGLSALKDTYKIDKLSSVATENVLDILLEPKSRTIIFEGVDFDAVKSTTSGTSILIDNFSSRATIEQLHEETHYYEGTPLETYPVPDTYAGYAKLTPLTNIEVKYDGILNKYIVTYYKGTIPTLDYDATITYYDEVTNAVLGTDTIATRNVFLPADLNVPEYDGYSVDYMDIIHGTEGTETLQKEDIAEYNYHLPKRTGVASRVGGHYDVNVYYSPYVEIDYTEYFDYELDKTLDRDEHVVALKNFSAIYDDTISYTYEPTQDINEFEVTAISIDGVTDEEPVSPNVDIVPNKNTQLEVLYTPKLYSLNVNYIDRTNNTVGKVNKFLNRSLNMPIQILPIDIAGYEFRGIEGVGNATDYLTVNETSADFAPAESGAYDVNLYYDLLGEVDVQYVDIAETELMPTETFKSYVGQDLEIATPTTLATDYKLYSVYVDNVNSDEMITGNDATIPVSKTKHTVKLIYVKDSINQLQVLSSEGGTATGSGSYYPEQLVTIEAYPEEGYDFVNWVVETPEAVTIENLNATSTVVTMPDYNVTVRAVFESNSTIVDPIDPVDPVEPEKPEKPEKPSKPDVDIDIDIDTEGETDEIEEIGPTDPIIMIPSENNNKPPLVVSNEARYKPYIVGYDNGLAGPQDPIKRNEVVQIIYNLLYNPAYNIDYKYLDGYTDVNEDSWYADAVAFCVEYGFISGEGDFRADDVITRAEIAVILSNILKNSVAYVPSEDGSFSDTEGHWAEEYINILESNGVASGFTDGSFKPNADASRAEFCAFINRTLKRPDSFEETNTFPDLPESHWAYDDMMNAANGNYPAYLELLEY